MTETSNPHWVDGMPAWDVTLSDGQVHKSVTQRELRPALSSMASAGNISLYDSYILGCVCQHHIDAYDKYHTAPRA